MAKTTYTETLLHDTDANFRSWATNLHNALIAVGLVQTSDTGQADFTTVARPSAGLYVYKIYRFNDALQSAAPVFLRVEYGTSATNGAGVRIGMGRGTDGAGNLTVTFSNASNFSVGSSTASITAGNSARTWVCFKDGAFSLAWAADATGVGSAFRYIHTMDRTRDGAGVANDEGLYYAVGPSNWAQNMWTHGWLGLKTGQGSFGPTTNVSCWVPGNAGATTFSNKVQAFKHFTLPQLERTHLSPLTVVGSEIGNVAVIDVEIFGSTHQYLSLGGYSTGGFSTGYCTTGSGSNNNANAAHKPLILWED